MRGWRERRFWTERNLSFTERQWVERFLHWLGWSLVWFVLAYWAALVLWAWHSGAIERLVTR